MSHVRSAGGRDVREPRTGAAGQPPSGAATAGQALPSGAATAGQGRPAGAAKQTGQGRASGAAKQAGQDQAGSPPEHPRAAQHADVPAADLAIDATRLRVALARLARRLRRHQLAGLTPTQLSCLATVEKAGPMRLGDLAAAEGIAPSTLTRLVTALEDAGHVRRCAVPQDARASVLQITPAGMAVLGRIRDESTTVLTGMLMLLTPHQQACVAAALPALEQLAGADPREAAASDATGR